MPPRHELEKIAVELAFALVAAVVGLLAGRSRYGKRFVRGAAYVMLAAVLLVIVAWVLIFLFVRDLSFKTSSFGLYTTVCMIFLMPPIAAVAAIAGTVAGIVRTRTTGQWVWLTALLVGSAAPLALALILFAINLSHVEPNSSLVLKAVLSCALSIPAVVAFAFTGTRREPDSQVVVNVVQETEPA